ncbi:unnamed protein product [Vitrella brassicaformis CCMP3155]|uniref:F-box domain-containing protein n=2 Tax=Vitrella brassicaformis TaxID=1169539 RepID=A0A0G4ED24_VITBC|nr:unnamed protein product [Vitrella brassicaformis CCMP3155]|eukprot:CEL93460.1 unnamed protein product [Vitrella brassicaformis CCMP3155]
MMSRSRLSCLPDDIIDDLKRHLSAASCGAVRATSKRLGCHFISEDYLTRRLDDAIHNKKLSGVPAYIKRPETALQRVTAVRSSVSTCLRHFAAFAVEWIAALVTMAALLAVVFLLVPWTLKLHWVLQVPFWAASFYLMGTVPHALELLGDEGMTRVHNMETEAFTYFREMWRSAWRALWIWVRSRDRKVRSRVDYLLRLLHVIEEGGCWDWTVQLIYYLENSRIIPSLLIIIAPADLRQVGSRALFDSRPPAVRQLSLISHRLVLQLETADGPKTLIVRLQRRANGQEDHLDGQLLTFLTPSTVPDTLPFKIDEFNASDPPTKWDHNIYPSFTDLIIHIASRTARSHDGAFDERPRIIIASEIVHGNDQQLQSADRQIAASRGPVWEGCRRADKCGGTPTAHETILILCGDKAGDEFAVSYDIFLPVAQVTAAADIVIRWIITTEPPVTRHCRPAAQRFPRTVAVVHKKLLR